MSILWQQIIIGAALIGAVGYLVRHFMHKRKKRPCANCGLMKMVEKRPVDERRRPVSR